MPRHLSWAALLRRVLDIDDLTCPKCRTPLVVLACLSDPPFQADDSGLGGLRDQDEPRPPSRAPP